ncbi:unnamed protein product [Prorocentrum cordatum]|uniref:Cellulase n=1 Tax=Prorocentrum cordatum TaxID=2364126 RepID=A0ABN9RGT3_9DINO|nr:unnamed protein product [Polarella glacialis]
MPPSRGPAARQVLLRWCLAGLSGTSWTWPAAAGQEFRCWPGSAPCTLGPFRFGAAPPSASDPDAAALAPEGAECGNLSGAPGAGAVLLEGVAASSAVSFPVPPNATGSPGRWTICYCVNSPAGRCLGIEGFSVFAGTLTVAGPHYASDLSCTLGLPCSLTLEGLDLAQADALILVSAADSCGSAAEWNAYEGFSWPLRPDLAVGPHSYSLGTATAGPVGPAGRLCWGRGGRSWRDYVVEVGVLSVVGPHFTGELSCVLGGACALELPGHGMDVGSEVWLGGGATPPVAVWKVQAAAQAAAYACSADAALDLSHFEGLGHPQPASVTGALGASFYMGVPLGGPVGALYQVCWRYTPMSTTTTFTTASSSTTLTSTSATSSTTASSSATSSSTGTTSTGTSSTTGSSTSATSSITVTTTTGTSKTTRSTSSATSSATVTITTGSSSVTSSTSLTSTSETSSTTRSSTTATSTTTLTSTTATSTNTLSNTSATSTRSSTTATSSTTVSTTTETSTTRTSSTTHSSTTGTSSITLTSATETSSTTRSSTSATSTTTEQAVPLAAAPAEPAAQV